MPVFNPKPKEKRYTVTAKPWKCAGCGRLLPAGSKLLIWRIWNQGHKERFRFCSDCQDVIYGCKERRALDVWGDFWIVRDMCECCDAYPICDKIGYLKSSREGDIYYGDLPDGRI